MSVPNERPMVVCQVYRVMHSVPVGTVSIDCAKTIISGSLKIGLLCEVTRTILQKYFQVSSPSVYTGSRCQICYFKFNALYIKTFLYSTSIPRILHGQGGPISNFGKELYKWSREIPGNYIAIYRSTSRGCI